jgi:RimJ/RimL family protein N-acetyltransferase
MVELQDIRTSDEHPEFLVRPAVPEDAAAIIDYLDIVLADRMSSIADKDEMVLDTWSEREHLKRIQANPLALALVAEHGREVIGFLTCEGGRRRKIAHVGEIGMSVREDWRRKGVGTALMECVENWARSTGKIGKLSLNVFERNVAAIALYNKKGFVIEGRLKGQIQLDSGLQDLILMSKHL